MYQFEKLHKFLDKKGFPKVKKQVGFKIVRNVDFKEAHKEGKVEFRDEGIFIGDRQVYVHKKSYPNKYLDIANNKTPRIHLRKCSTINQYGIQSFTASNDKTHDITNRDTGEVYEDLTLLVCRHCLKEFEIEGIKDSQDFYKKITKKQKSNETKIDMFGYTHDFHMISKKYRELKKYTCEKCGLQPKLPRDRIHWHCHHIDGNKINNHPDNLQCLCIVCHSEVDEIHQENFKKSAKEIKNFRQKYSCHL